MMIKVLLLLVISLGTAASLTGCSKGYPPVIVNGYKTEARITAYFNKGDSKTYDLTAGEHLFQGGPGLLLTRLDVITDGGTPVQYTKEILDQARKKAVHRFEVWILSSAGLELRGEGALKDLTR